VEALTPAILLPRSEVFDPNRQCVVCLQDLKVLRLALFSCECGGLEMRMVIHAPEQEEDYARRIRESVAIVDTAKCLRTFMERWADAREGLVN
jgi:hypothetical protein